MLVCLEKSVYTTKKFIPTIVRVTAAIDILQTKNCCVACQRIIDNELELNINNKAAKLKQFVH